jgi:hypothetical protein
MGFLFRAYEPRPNYYPEHFHPGSTPNPSQPHYSHQPHYPHHGQYHGYDYLNQLDIPEHFPYPYPYDHSNYGYQVPYSNNYYYQQYNQHQQAPIPYEPFIYDNRAEDLVHSDDVQRPE